MTDQIHYKGIWFLPENPDNKIAGTLDYSPSEGIELRLLGMFREKKESESKIINGIAADGTQITLYKCWIIQKGFNSASFETSAYSAIIYVYGRFIRIGERTRI